MTYEMTFKAHDKHENNLLKNKKDLAFRTNKDHSSESSSDDELKLLTIKFKRFIKQELKNKNKLKNKLPKKKRALKVTWDEMSISEEEEQTNEDETTNFALVTLDNEVNNSNETSFVYFKIT